MRIAFYGDSLTRGIPGVSVFRMLVTKLPSYTLINRGRGGDTVISLCRRIARERKPESIDLAVLWVGVNDILATISPGHSIIKWLMRQPSASDPIEFREYYVRTLTQLRERADNVLALSPLLIGEDLSNRWNRQLADLSEIVAELSSSFEHVHYLDLRAECASKWLNGTPSDYLPRSVTRIGLESLFLRRSASVDKVAVRRGLQLTLDGVHLNSAGVDAVAASMKEAITALSKPASADYRLASDQRSLADLTNV